MGRYFWVVIFLPLTHGGFPYIVRTRGEIWPLPQFQEQMHGSLPLYAENFEFVASGYSCDILIKAFYRYSLIMFGSTRQNITAMDEVKNLIVNEDYSIPSHQFSIKRLKVHVKTPCEDYPYHHMNENYDLKICSTGNPEESTLTARSIWGALRGLETFSQIPVIVNSSTFTVKCTRIIDYPRFPHRGVMLDTSRHFLPVSTIKQNLDLMAMNKFNVFHWHIVDDQSFPYQSTVYPNLSIKGAWSHRHIYTQKDVSEIIDYARDLGIRVIVEFDTPGHVRSWEGQPGLLTPCSISGKFGPPIDPSREENFEFLENFFEEISFKFPEYYLHIGGDEVNFECWRSNANITEFMEALNITGDYSKLEEYYIQRLMTIVTRSSPPKGTIVWQEVFDNGARPHLNTIIQIWKYPGQPFRYIPKMYEVTAAGYRALMSACWYLNYIQYGTDWHKFYDCDPHDFSGSDEQKRLVLGGEACMWGEYVDETNVISTTWPRASPVAERLWSPKHLTTSADEAAPRLEEHRCRLFDRGYNVGPLGPSFCPGVP